jgi:DNA topoisomerase-1
MSKGKALIIVESPSKIKTLRKFLGDNYFFESSVGHIRDLPEREFGIDIENDFTPNYTLLPDKKEVVERLRKAAKKADIVYLSPDPDREGEAIAWHITQILPSGTLYKRVSFNSITKEAVIKALNEPRDIDEALVNAQQARRLLDRIVGYKISPILNRRIHRGKEGSVSAGRVQSVALKLVVDREKEIEAFVPVEYWNLAALLSPEEGIPQFRATLYSVAGERIEKELVEGKSYSTVPNKETADQLLARLKKASYRVSRVERKEKKRNPVPPFITSTLQQEASRHHGFSSARTMSTAQSLYEGVDLSNEGAEGLITYMRTDSTRVAPEAIQHVRQLIAKQYGPEYLPDQPRYYTSKKNAQDAHEAIRPTNLQLPPEKIKPYLSREQFLLYDLIWKRFVSSQMNPAIYDTLSADIETDQELVLRATGSLLKFPGFLAVYEEKSDDEGKDDESRQLPPLEEGQRLRLHELFSDQAFTKPPPRFSEASLVKELERLGIGRPSTFVAIMNKIQSRDYTVKEANRLKPTELGRVIAGLLEDNFKQIMNIGFTAQMEDDLESVAESRKDWKFLLREFWTAFAPTLEAAQEGAFVPKVETDIDCPKCGLAKLQKIWYKSKYFYGCARYPDCDFRAPLEELTFNRADYAEGFNWDQPCPVCGGEMKVRHGRFGAFLGCLRYPDCKGIVNIPKRGESIINEADMPPCPAKGCDGQLKARRSRFGKVFYSCSNYPDCDVIVNQLEDAAVKYANHPKTPYVKKEGGRFKKGAKSSATRKVTKASPKGAKSKSIKTAKSGPKRQTGMTQPMALSPALADVVEASQMSRAEIMKQLWVYIKKHQLQDPTNGRRILPDTKLAKVFGSDRPVDMFAMSKVISAHIKGVE